METIINTQPTLTKENVIEHFGYVKYSCESTHDGTWFHTIIKDNWSIYIEEWEDEIVSTIYKNEQRITGLCDIEMNMMLIQIKEFVK